MNKIEIGIYYYEDEDGNRMYDYEGMVDEFEQELSMLDQSVKVNVSVEDKPKHYTSGCGGQRPSLLDETPTDGYANLRGC
jgi:hypothetical protein|tara:strand:- start:45 stop:284 length:240 start_codon:yes stop_codon:yes gene_type:complete